LYCIILAISGWFGDVKSVDKLASCPLLLLLSFPENVHRLRTVDIFYVIPRNLPWTSLLSGLVLSACITHWVTLFFRNTKVLHQTTGLTPN